MRWLFAHKREVNVHRRRGDGDLLNLVAGKPAVPDGVVRPDGDAAYARIGRRDGKFDDRAIGGDAAQSESAVSGLREVDEAIAAGSDSERLHGTVGSRNSTIAPFAGFRRSICLARTSVNQMYPPLATIRLGRDAADYHPGE
jgi:hypothetical protein